MDEDPELGMLGAGDVIRSLDEYVDPFTDDTPLECGIENPDECEACQ